MSRWSFLRSIWNYVFGLAMVTLYAVIFLHTRLYSDALLQVFFLRRANLWLVELVPRPRGCG